MRFTLRNALLLVFCMSVMISAIKITSDTACKYKYALWKSAHVGICEEMINSNYEITKDSRELGLTCFELHHERKVAFVLTWYFVKEVVMNPKGSRFPAAIDASVLNPNTLTVFSHMNFAR